MYRYILSLLLILLVGTAFGQVKNQRDPQGKKQGYWEAIDRNGKLVYSGYFKDDKPVGEMTRYFPTGEVRVKMIYDQNGENSRARFFWQNKELAATGNYVGTKRDSVWTFYSYYTKAISYKATYKDGLRNGISQSFYPNGKIAEEILWSNDQKDGLWKQYFDNEQLKLSTTYKNNKLEGTYTSYYPDGNKETEGFYQNDLPDGKWIYYTDDEQIGSTILYDNGEVMNRDELDAAEREFFRKIEEQKDLIKEPTIEDLIRESSGI